MRTGEGPGRAPTGFTATCQCGRITGALDYLRTPRAESAKVLGDWLQRGCQVTPMFGPQWTVLVEACECEAQAQAALREQALRLGRQTGKTGMTTRAFRRAAGLDT